jgi:hypothetical protein
VKLTFVRHFSTAVLEVSDLKNVYDVSKHPKVIGGQLTEDEALQEFLDGFEGGAGPKDGIVSPDEWIEYYKGVSCMQCGKTNSLVPYCNRFVSLVGRARAHKAYRRSSIMQPCTTKTTTASIDSDRYFTHMMNSAWKFTDTARARTGGNKAPKLDTVR